MLLDSPTRTRRFKAGNLVCLIESVGDLIASGGPKPEDYAALNRSIRKVADDVRAGVVPAEVVKAFVGEITEKHFTGSLQAAARA